MNPITHSFSLTPRTPSGPRRPRPARSGIGVALLDDRFVAWLSQRDCEPGEEPVLSRRNLMRVLSRLLAETGTEMQLRRVYWYTDRPDGQLVDDQITRLVGAEARSSPEVTPGETVGDGALESWQAIDNDLRAISRSQAFDLVIIGSDDERLLQSIDEAQLAGMSITLLADDSVSDYPALSVEEPEWAALLAQADRRLIVRPTDLADLKNGPRNGSEESEGSGRSSEQALIEEVVRSWWADQPQDAREDLRAALQLGPGIPQDVDRALLLQSRERFVRPLSFGEKKMMRECLREVVASTDETEDEEATLA
jgi:hypothetical protein